MLPTKVGLSPKALLGEHISRQTIIIRIILLTWATLLLTYFVWKGLISHSNTSHYEDWAISEWMINYEGGFVRRGLAGQLLFWAFEWNPFPLRTAIEWLVLTSTVAFYSALGYLFRKEGWSTTILFAPFLIQTMCIYTFEVRKDFFLLALAWGIFRIYAHLQTNKKKLSMVLMQLLLAVLLLIHEAAFFFTVPFIAVYIFYTEKKKSLSTGSAILKACIFFLPACLVMALVCYYKGSADIVNHIWASWETCMQLYPLPNSPNETFNGVHALTWETIPTFKFHLYEGWGKNFCGNVPAWPFHLINFAAIYYLVTRMNTIDLKWNKISAFNAVKLSNVLLVQGIFMLPLFTVLSVDFGRTVPYWLLTTFIIYHYFKKDLDAFPTWLTSLSGRLQGLLDRAKFLSNPWVYLIIMLCLPYATICAPSISTSPVLKIVVQVFDKIGILIF